MRCNWVAISSCFGKKISLRIKRRSTSFRKQLLFTVVLGSGVPLMPFPSPPFENDILVHTSTYHIIIDRNQTLFIQFICEADLFAFDTSHVLAHTQIVKFYQLPICFSVIFKLFCLRSHNFFKTIDWNPKIWSINC